MTTALVTGASGFVGTHLLAHLMKLGWRIRLTRRDSVRLPDIPVESVCEVGIDSPTGEWVRACSDVDVVFHLAGIAHRKGAQQELEAVNARSPALIAQAAAQSGVGAFVWLSSIKVLGEVSGQPLREAAVYAPADEYSRSKVLGEQRLLAQSGDAEMRVSIVRPPLIYGPGVKANFAALLGLARLARRGLPVPLGAAQAPRSLLAVSVLCDYLVTVAERGRGIFHVADRQDLSVAALLEALCSPQTPRLWSVPPGIVRGALTLLGRGALYSRLFEPLQLDCSDSYQRLDWQPPADSRSELNETMAWFLNR